MNAFSILAAALLMLTGPATVAAEPAGEPEAGTARGPDVRVNRAFLVGAWTDDGDCGHAIEFLGDGRFFGSDGLRGIWQLEGAELTMAGDNILTVRIVPLDQDRMGVIGPDGALGQSTRCVAGEELRPGIDEIV